MSCFPCFPSKAADRTRSLSVGRSLGTTGSASTINQHHPAASPPRQQQQQQQQLRCSCNQPEEGLKAPASRNTAEETFSFRELATATKNFRQECLIGEGGFGRVYKGKLEQTGQIVAVKQLDRNGLHGNKEFLNEVDMLSLLLHENLVNLIGHCADGDQRLLVYEYMPLGSLEDHLLDLTSEQEPLNWSTRMKIALETAKGLEYLHYKANPPLIYRDLKSSNILLDEGYNVKLSDFGLAKQGPVGDKSHVSTVVRGTYGYCAPESQRTGHLTVKSDIYSFGVVLLELITGRRAIEIALPVAEQCLVSWAQPIFKDKTRFTKLADPLLEGEIPSIEFDQAIAVVAMCLQEEPSSRPLISDVVEALSFLGAEQGTTSHSNLSSTSANRGRNYTEDSISGASYASSRSGSSSHHSTHLHGH